MLNPQVSGQEKMFAVLVERTAAELNPLRDELKNLQEVEVLTYAQFSRYFFLVGAIQAGERAMQALLEMEPEFPGKKG